MHLGIKPRNKICWHYNGNRMLPQKLAHGTSHTILYTPNATQVAKMLIKKISAKKGNFGTANGCQTRSNGW